MRGIRLLVTLIFVVGQFAMFVPVVQANGEIISNDLVITEFQVSGKCLPSVLLSCTSTNSAEFVELYNSGTQDISLDNYKLIFQNSSGTRKDLAVFDSGAVLQPDQFSLVVRDIEIPAMANLKTSLTDTTGAIILVDISNPENHMDIDQVAWGEMETSFYGEGPISAPKTNASAQRCFVTQN